ncbi:CLD14 protein, partial [Polyodon spathula]|nr:CLD14 protein [Polyodon spathula]
MASVELELSGFALGILGLLGTLLATVLPHWRTTVYIDSNIITAVGYLKGRMGCAYFSTGTVQCEIYCSLLALPPDLQAARAMMVISVILSTLDCVVSSIGMKYEVGVALYLSMLCSVLSLLAGGMLCASCCGQEGGSGRPGVRLIPYPNRNPHHSQPMTFWNPAVQNSSAIGSIKHNTSHDGYNLDGYV